MANAKLIRLQHLPVYISLCKFNNSGPNRNPWGAPYVWQASCKRLKRPRCRRQKIHLSNRKSVVQFLESLGWTDTFPLMPSSVIVCITEECVWTKRELGTNVMWMDEHADQFNWTRRYKCSPFTFFIIIIKTWSSNLE